MAPRKPKKSPEALAAETASIGRWMTIEEVELWAKNPRKNEGQPVDKVAASIVRFGFVAPVVGWLREDGSVRMVAGHTRVKALRKLLAERGADWTPKHAPGPGVVPVRVIPFANEAEANAYALADNRLAEEAEWDDGLLSEVVKDLEGVFDGLEAIGFDEKELARVANYHAHEPSPSDDEVPPVEEGEPDSKTGQVYELGPHRLVCGDCTTVEAWSTLGPVDVVPTDPPYGIAGTASVKNDYRTYEDTKENLEGVIRLFMPHALAAAPVVVLTPGNGNHRMYPAPTWEMAWFTPAGTGSGPWGFCCWQPILCYGKDPKLSCGLGRHPDAIVHTEASEDFGHPCTKPIKFWRWLLERVSEQGQIITDPFSGSGTTLIACAMTGRVARCIEIDPHYCDVIRRRWTRFAREHGQDPGPGALE